VSKASRIPSPPEDRPRTIAVFSVSAGAGHVRAAEALVATARIVQPELRVVHIDLMDLVPKLFRTMYAETYIPMVQHHPALWGYLYAQSDRRIIDSASDRLRTALERLNTQKLKTVLRDLAPDSVICTHFLPAELFSRWRRKKLWRTPVWAVVTDFDAHMLWVYRHLNGYCVAAEETGWRLRARNPGDARIEVTGIPVMPAFSEPGDRASCAREIGLNPGRLTLLLMSGGAGVFPLQKLARRILALDPEIQLIALAGKNRRLLDALRGVASEYPGRMVPFPFTTSIERLMAASDLAVTKSGGLTTAECLAVGLPMIILAPIPGQEERNADFLLEHGAALKAYDEAGVEFKLRTILADARRLPLMRERARSLGKPDAAEAILRVAGAV
jgi:processive 1,2-diacylglycerol beta-glucosyltransferase